MNRKLPHQFTREVLVNYRGERYRVRDNGAVCRLQKTKWKLRPLDERWTLGHPCNKDGYMKICSQAVHRIVATAFHGEQPSLHHVVDHIDTNRRNNRPDNLRWVTRLQNITDNAKTIRRIRNKWGSIEGLLSDPNPAERTDPLSNRPWMWEVEIEAPKKGDSTIESLTAIALQRNWKTPSEFPLCPEQTGIDPLQDYAYRLMPGSVFSRNRYGESIVFKSQRSTDGSYLGVLCEMANSVKGWALSKVTYENGKYVHSSEGTFFTCEGGEKSFSKLVGVSWVAPKGYQGCIDDYC